MPHDHGPAENASFDTPATSRRNARVGMVLFVIYLAFYAGFVALAAFWPAVMERPSVGGVNLAVAYGLALIFSAFALALLYAWLCRHPAAPKQEGGQS